MIDHGLDEIASGPTLPHRVLRTTDAGAEPEDIQVVVEEPLSLAINGQEAAVLMRLPGHEKELAAGFCLSEGLVASMDDLLLIHHCGRGLPAPGEASEDLALTSRNRVEIQAREQKWRAPGDEVARLIRSGCGAVGVQVGELELPVLKSSLRVESRVLLSLNAAMRSSQGLFRDVGALHAAAIFDTSGDLVVLREDIGRHNAMDKVMGHCLLRNVSLRDKIITTTGRASYEMVSKAVRASIPIVASFSSPTSLAIQVADAHGCTLIGYMRGNRFSIYTHPERVAVPEA